MMVQKACKKYKVTDHTGVGYYTEKELKDWEKFIAEQGKVVSVKRYPKEHLTVKVTEDDYEYAIKKIKCRKHKR